MPFGFLPLPPDSVKSIPPSAAAGCSKRSGKREEAAFSVTARAAARSRYPLTAGPTTVARSGGRGERGRGRRRIGRRGGGRRRPEAGGGRRICVEDGGGVADQDGAYCSEHPYPPGAAAAAGGAGAGGICAFCLQEKLGMLVSSSKSSPFHPPPPAVSASPSSPPSNGAASEPPLPLHPSAASRKVMPPSQMKAKTSSAPSVAPPATGLKRSKSVAPRPEDPPLVAPAPSAITADSPRKKSFWSFLHLSSSSGSHKNASSSVANGWGVAAARRNSVSVASASAASLGGRLEAIVEPESPGRRSEGSSSTSFGRNVARSRSVGCGSRSFSGDFLERLSNGFGDCALRRVESHREPKPKAGALGHLGGAHGAAGDGDDDEHGYAQRNRIKCAGFFGGVGAAPPPSSSYWLSAPDGASAGAGVGSATRAHGGRSHRSWAWALASPMRALRPTSSSSSKSIMAAPHSRAVGGNGSMPAMAAVATN